LVKVELTKLIATKPAMPIRRTTQAFISGSELLLDPWLGSRSKTGWAESRALTPKMRAKVKDKTKNLEINFGCIEAFLDRRRAEINFEFEIA